MSERWLGGGGRRDAFGDSSDEELEHESTLNLQAAGHQQSSGKEEFKKQDHQSTLLLSGSSRYQPGEVESIVNSESKICGDFLMQGASEQSDKCTQPTRHTQLLLSSSAPGRQDEAADLAPFWAYSDQQPPYSPLRTPSAPLLMTQQSQQQHTTSFSHPSLLVAETPRTAPTSSYYSAAKQKKRAKEGSKKRDPPSTPSVMMRSSASLSSTTSHNQRINDFAHEHNLESLASALFINDRTSHPSARAVAGSFVSTTSGSHHTLRTHQHRESSQQSCLPLLPSTLMTAPVMTAASASTHQSPKGISSSSVANSTSSADAAAAPQRGIEALAQSFLASPSDELSIAAALGAVVERQPIPPPSSARPPPAQRLEDVVLIAAAQAARATNSQEMLLMSLRNPFHQPSESPSTRRLSDSDMHLLDASTRSGSSSSPSSSMFTEGGRGPTSLQHLHFPKAAHQDHQSRRRRRSKSAAATTSAQPSAFPLASSSSPLPLPPSPQRVASPDAASLASASPFEQLLAQRSMEALLMKSTNQKPPPPPPPSASAGGVASSLSATPSAPLYHKTQSLQRTASSSQLPTRASHANSFPLLSSTNALTSDVVGIDSGVHSSRTRQQHGVHNVNQEDGSPAGSFPPPSVPSIIREPDVAELLVSEAAASLLPTSMIIEEPEVEIGPLQEQAPIAATPPPSHSPAAGEEQFTNFILSLVPANSSVASINSGDGAGSSATIHHSDVRVSAPDLMASSPSSAVESDIQRYDMRLPERSARGSRLLCLAPPIDLNAEGVGLEEEQDGVGITTDISIRQRAIMPTSPPLYSQHHHHFDDDNREEEASFHQFLLVDQFLRPAATLPPSSSSTGTLSSSECHSVATQSCRRIPRQSQVRADAIEYVDNSPSTASSAQAQRQLSVVLDRHCAPAGAMTLSARRASTRTVTSALGGQFNPQTNSSFRCSFVPPPASSPRHRGKLITPPRLPHQQQEQTKTEASNTTPRGGVAKRPPPPSFGRGPSSRPATYTYNRQPSAAAAGRRALPASTASSSGNSSGSCRASGARESGELLLRLAGKIGRPRHSRLVIDVPNAVLLQHTSEGGASSSIKRLSESGTLEGTTSIEVPFTATRSRSSDTNNTLERKVECYGEKPMAAEGMAAARRRRGPRSYADRQVEGTAPIDSSPGEGGERIMSRGDESATTEEDGEGMKPALPWQTSLPSEESTVLALPTSAATTGLTAINSAASSSSSLAAVTTADGEVLALRRRYLCSVQNCEKQAKRGGLCKAHGGHAVCKHQGCTRFVQTGGLCIGHGGGKKCEVDGCIRAVQSSKMCKRHQTLSRLQQQQLGGSGVMETDSQQPDQLSRRRRGGDLCHGPKSKRRKNDAAFVRPKSASSSSSIIGLTGRPTRRKKEVKKKKKMLVTGDKQHGRGSSAKMMASFSSSGSYSSSSSSSSCSIGSPDDDSLDGAREKDEDD